MHFSSSLLIAAAVGVAQAQTPPGFTPAADMKLDVIFNATKVSSPGALLSKAETAAPPQLALPISAVSPDDTYLFMMVDLDVPAASSNSSRRVLLHAMTTGFRATQQPVSGGGVLLRSTDRGPASYFGPSPPPSDTIPHRYTQLLYKQPESLSLSTSDFADMNSRFEFDVGSFARMMCLGEPMAGNFFTVDGRMGASAASASGGATGTAGAWGTAAATASASGWGGRPTGVPEFQGSAGKARVSLGLVGLVGGLTAMAM